MGALFDDFLTAKTNISTSDQRTFQTSTTNNTSSAFDYTFSPTYVINSAGAGVSPSVTKEQRVAASASSGQMAAPSSNQSQPIAQSWTTVALIAAAGLIAYGILK